jgi:8-oxo-dGTP pyrophosphatase MutT (NUDIX family)
VNPRHSVRALVLDELDRVLLCGHVVVRPENAIVWAAPGGGIERGETPFEALRRELIEEVGLVLDSEPPHVWRQEVVTAGLGGVRNDYFLVRTASFIPCGTSDPAAEGITGSRWWSLAELAAHRGPGLLSPRDLATPLTALLADGVPERPLSLGL